MSKTEQAIREQLRDRFASSALEGMLANPNNDGYQKDFAMWAYEYADAMLEARGKK